MPLLLQLFIWYFILTETLPTIEEALRPLPGVFFSKNGLQFPIPIWAPGHAFTLAGLGLGLGLLAAWWWRRLAQRHFEPQAARARSGCLACCCWWPLACWAG